MIYIYNVIRNTEAEVLVMILFIQLGPTIASLLHRVDVLYNAYWSEISNKLNCNFPCEYVKSLQSSDD